MSERGGMKSTVEIEGGGGSTFAISFDSRAEGRSCLFANMRRDAPANLSSPRRQRSSSLNNNNEHFING